MTAEEFLENNFGITFTKRKDEFHNEIMADWLKSMDDYADYKIKSKVEAITDECKWENDEEYEYYETECSGAYTFIDGGVKENKYKYCPNCGRKIKEV